MILIKYDEKGRVYGLPDSLSQSGSETFKIYSTFSDLSTADDFELKLSFAQSVKITNGDFVFGFGADSTPPIKAVDCSPFALQIILNRLDSVISAGGLKAYNNVISFNEAGIRGPITLTHSILGDLTGRCITAIAGDAQSEAVYRLDLAAQTLESSTSATDIPNGTVTVAEIVAGSSTTIQIDRITIDRPPLRGLMRASDGLNLSDWVAPNASGYELMRAMECNDIVGINVTKSNLFEASIYDVSRSLVGEHDPITVEHTFVWPAGISLGMNLAGINNILATIGYFGPISAVLSLAMNGVSQFEQSIRLEPPLQSAGPVI